MAGRLMADVFIRNVQFLVDKRMTPQQIGELVGTTARASRDGLIASGAFPRVYRTFVDGTEGKLEEFVSLHHGEIAYIANLVPDAAFYAWAYCREISPTKGTGAYKESWIILIDNQVWKPGDPIRRDIENAVVVSYAPYSRRLDPEFSAYPPHYRIALLAAQATRRKFPGLSVQRRYVGLNKTSDGRWPVPWVRKTPPKRPILYPAVVIGYK